MINRIRTHAYQKIVWVTLAMILSCGGVSSPVLATDLSGKVVFMRHALAPGNGDPNHFDLESCSTQRNLDEEGRQQAKRIGEKLRDRHVPVRSNLLERMVSVQETAKLLNMGEVTPLRALNSFMSITSLGMNYSRRWKRCYLMWSLVMCRS